jgi:Tol biopolymer transport system component
MNALPFQQVWLILFLILAPTTTVWAQVERISIDTEENQAGGDSYQASISDDGSVIVFRSNAGNLVVGDTNEWPDIFVRDQSAGTTERVSLTTNGEQTTSYSKAPHVSGDGRIIVYEGRSGGITTVFVHDRIAGTHVSPLPDTTNGAASPPTQARVDPKVSGDGRFVVFQTDSTLQNLFPDSIRPAADDGDTDPDIFVYDLQTAPTPPIQRISRLSNGDSLNADNRNPVLNTTGQFAAFESFSDLLVGDANNHADILHKDRQSGLLQLVSATPTGDSGNAASLEPDLSGDGNFVAFRSGASDLVPGDTNDRLDIFVRDLSAGTTERVSVSSNGDQADQNSFEPSISNDGRYVVFRSNATNLVPDDTNLRTDIFVHDRDTGETARASHSAGVEANGNSSRPAISGDGRWIVFESDADNLVVNDTNEARDIFRVANPLFAPLRFAQTGDEHE